MANIVFSDREILGGSPVVFEELGGFSLKSVSRAAKKAVKNPVGAANGTLRSVDRASVKVTGVSASKAVQKVAKAGKVVVKSPYVRVGAAGLAVVFPPAGVPAMAAVETANLVLKAAEDGQKQAKDIVEATRKLASAGNPDAKRGLAVLNAQATARGKMQANRANPTAGAVRPTKAAAVKPSVAVVLSQVKHSLTPGTGKPPSGSVKVRGLWVTREGIVFRE